MQLELTMNNERAKAVTEALQNAGYEFTTKPVGKKHTELILITDKSELRKLGELIDSV